MTTEDGAAGGALAGGMANAGTSSAGAPWWIARHRATRPLSMPTSSR